MKEIRVFSPATVANVNCGFDVLGFALDGLGDEMVIRKVPEKGIKITEITGADLPYEAKENVVGVAGLAMVEALDLDYGFEVEIHKKIRLGSGVGSSAASASGIVFGINQFHCCPQPLKARPRRINRSLRRHVRAANKSPWGRRRVLDHDGERRRA